MTDHIDRAPRRRKRTWWHSALGAGVLVLAIATLPLHRESLAQPPQAIDKERRAAIAQIEQMLAAVVPAPQAAIDQSAPAAMHAGPQTAEPALEEPGRNLPPATSAAPAVSQPFTPRPRGEGTVRKSPAARPRIPDIIEGAPVAKRDSDALANLSVESALRLLDARQAPFEVLALRLDARPPRVQLLRRGAAGPSITTGWLEVGDSPQSDWRVIDISPSGVVLLTPKGNPLSLHSPGEPSPSMDQQTRLPISSVR